MTGGAGTSPGHLISMLSLRGAQRRRNRQKHRYLSGHYQHAVDEDLGHCAARQQSHLAGQPESARQQIHPDDCYCEPIDVQRFI
jgi:hypothetical protein